MVCVLEQGWNKTPRTEFDTPVLEVLYIPQKNNNNNNKTNINEMT